ncbi:hypothetical protein CBL_11831 [Carabus blaptoides fortunei]
MNELGRPVATNVLHVPLGTAPTPATYCRENRTPPQTGVCIYLVSSITKTVSLELPQPSPHLQANPHRLPGSRQVDNKISSGRTICRSINGRPPLSSKTILLVVVLALKASTTDQLEPASLCCSTTQHDQPPQ